MKRLFHLPYSCDMPETTDTDFKKQLALSFPAALECIRKESCVFKFRGFTMQHWIHQPKVTVSLWPAGEWWTTPAFIRVSDFPLVAPKIVEKSKTKRMKMNSQEGIWPAWTTRWAFWWTGALQVVAVGGDPQSCFIWWSWPRPSSPRRCCWAGRAWSEPRLPSPPSCPCRAQSIPRGSGTLELEREQRWIGAGCTRSALRSTRPAVETVPVSVSTSAGGDVMPFFHVNAAWTMSECIPVGELNRLWLYKAAVFAIQPDTQRTYWPTVMFYPHTYDKVLRTRLWWKEKMLLPKQDLATVRLVYLRQAGSSGRAGGPQSS